MARNIRGALGGNLVRALRIARTEQLRAYRESTRRNYLENADVVKGWVWNSARSTNTCGSCWSMHGTKHGLDEVLDDHPNGKCSMLPDTFSWAELGLEGVEETGPVIEDGATAFDKMTDDQQLKVLGPAKYTAYKNGDITLKDLVGRKTSAKWGTMRYEKSLRELGLDRSELLKEYKNKLFIEKNSVFTEFGGIRIPKERLQHFLEGHPEVNSIEIEKILRSAITTPLFEQPSKKDKNAVMRYTLDENNKWWTAVIAFPENSSPFLLTFRRAHGKGK